MPKLPRAGTLPAYKFFYHFNKPASQSAGRVQISVHLEGPEINKCVLVDNLVCGVPAKGRLRTHQPRFAMQGVCHEWEVREGVMYLR